jgi:hypothetical protein
MAEEGNIGGAGPAFAAHSKDGSATGPTSSSRATGRPSSGGAPSNEAFDEMVGQVCGFVKKKPFVAAALMGAVGLIVGLLVGRR